MQRREEKITAIFEPDKNFCEEFGDFVMEIVKRRRERKPQKLEKNKGRKKANLPFSRKVCWAKHAN